MKPWLPWLLVPCAAWLGLRGGAVDPPSLTVPSQPQSPPPGPAWMSAATDGIARSDLDDLLRQLAALNDPPYSDEKLVSRRLICARLAELDPAAALEWLDTQDPGRTWQPRGLILTEWALLDSEAAWAHIPAGSEGDNDRRYVTAALLHEDRELFMRWFLRVRQPMPDGDPAWLLVAERHSRELEEMGADLVRQLENPEDGMVFDFAPLFHLLAKNRAASDPASAFEWASELHPAVRPAAIRGVLEAWGEVDPAAWRQAISLGDSPVASALLTWIAKEDPAAAMDLLIGIRDMSQLYNSGGIEAMVAALGPAMAAGEMDPVDAFRLVNSAKGTASYVPLNVFNRVWFGLPPERLAEAARGILAEPDEGHRGTALQGIAFAWMKSDRDAALAFISEIDDPAVRQRTFAGALQEANGSVEIADQIALLQQIPAEDRAGTFNAMITRMGGEPAAGEPYTGRTETRPELIAPLLNDAPPSVATTRAAGINALLWSELDPAAALDWAGSLADPAARRAAYAGAVDGWAFHDPFTAAAWLAEEPAGPERDAATMPLVRRVSASDPGGAWDWAASIQDPALQSEARLAALDAWSAQAPDEARAALLGYTATLSPAAAAEFLERHAAK